MLKLQRFAIASLLSGLAVILFQPTAKALILDTTTAVVRYCILQDLAGLGGVVDAFFWGIRVLFVLVVVGIIYILWSKRDDNENLQNWMRILGSLIVGAGLIGAFEAYFLGSANAAQSSCAASNSSPSAPSGVPPVPGQ
ncbi:hypothetical protein [Lyngbya confervoides]|uniref:TrbC/VIRB2 family protein n=1 Tax=Lyngbya confervoides BDU141951 TaxID=1574623 RepID=A0ABD4T0G6_9CYAN|nr:hypothetical protein [Lyngbya confervoides]MCM1982149.1 hypothetical protein [Lyngbya confervoides BDU141951]